MSLIIDFVAAICLSACLVAAAAVSIAFCVLAEKRGWGNFSSLVSLASLTGDSSSLGWSLGVATGAFAVATFFGAAASAAITAASASAAASSLGSSLPSESSLTSLSTALSTC